VRTLNVVALARLCVNDDGARRWRWL
jgi:hypothetical protein